MTVGYKSNWTTSADNDTALVEPDWERLEYQYLIEQAPGIGDDSRDVLGELDSGIELGDFDWDTGPNWGGSDEYFELLANSSEAAITAIQHEDWGERYDDYGPEDWEEYLGGPSDEKIEADEVEEYNGLLLERIESVYEDETWLEADDLGETYEDELLCWPETEIESAPENWIERSVEGLTADQYYDQWLPIVPDDEEVPS